MMKDRLYYGLILFAILTLPGSLKSQTPNPPIGETRYHYQTKLKAPLESITDLNFYDYDFPCVIKQNIVASSKPRTIYKVTDLNGEKLIGEEDGVLVWKGFTAKDPLFGIPETFVQFVGGVPIYNQEDPTSFDFEGTTVFYLYYYRLENLPKNIKEWAKANEVDKIKVKMQLSYTKTFVEEIASPYNKGMASVLGSEITMNIAELKAQIKKEWIVVPLDDNPVFEEYLHPIVQKYTSLHSDAYPLGTAYLYQEPEFKVEFSFKEIQLNLPDCAITDEQIYVFPNPNFGQINIKMIDMSAGDYLFDVYNIVGHKVWSKSMALDKDSNLIKFDLPTLEKGIYLYSVRSAEGVYLQSRRLVIVEP